MRPENAHLYIVPVAHCIFVKGASRTVLCDLQRQQLWFVPADMQHMLEMPGIRTLGEVYADAGPENEETLDEYFSFLLEKEAIFLTPHRADADRFTTLPLKNEYCSTIQNAIIDIKHWKAPSCFKSMAELVQLGCEHIQFRFFTPADFTTVAAIAACAADTGLRSVDFLIPWSETWEQQSFEYFLISNQRVGRLVFYHAPKNETQQFLSGLSTVQYTMQHIADQRSCGIVQPGLFVINQAHFSESQNHNTCLNRKISIDAEGYIKNCPSMAENFGNINDTTFAEALQKPGFKKYWNITKTGIAVCKDCEFRHICTDCRAYLENPDDIYSKPLKCGYDPYTATWQEWSTHPLKQKAIAAYGPDNHH